MLDIESTLARLTFKQILIIPITLALFLLGSVIFSEKHFYRQTITSLQQHEKKTRTLFSDLFSIKENLKHSFFLFEKNLKNETINPTEVEWIIDNMITSSSTISEKTIKDSVTKKLLNIQQQISLISTTPTAELSDNNADDIHIKILDTLNSITVDLNEYHIVAHNKNMAMQSNQAADLIISNGSMHSAIEAFLRNEPDHKDEIILLITSANKKLTPLLQDQSLGSLSHIINQINSDLAQLLQLTNMFYTTRNIDINYDLSTEEKSITALLINIQSDLNWLTSQLGRLVKEHDSNINAKMLNRELYFTLLSVAAMLLSAISLMGLFYLLNRRFQSLADGTEQIANGNLSFRLPTINNDVFSKFAFTFNRMAERLLDKDNIVKTALSDLSNSEQRIKEINASLEQAVEERTEKLYLTIESLETESRRRARAEVELRLAYQAIENINEAIIITDNQAIIIDINPAFSSITGFNRMDVIGQHCSFISAECNNKAFFDEVVEQLQKAGNWHGEVDNRRKNGVLYPAKMSISSIRDGEMITNYVGIFSDISDFKASEEKLTSLAFNDALTSLPNRLLFYERLEQACAQHRRQEQRFAVLFIDLDRFKEVNDTLGHEAGDCLLIEVSRRLKECTLRDTDTVARMGGDEFTVILTDLSRYEDSSIICRRMIDSISQPVSIADNDVQVGCSIGIAVYPNDGTDSASLTRHADIAMYNAKNNGRGSYKHFDSALQKAVLNRACIENDLKQALLNQEFRLHYQTIWSPEAHTTLKLEALLRWQHPSRGIILPEEFIPILEETGQMGGVGEWVLAEVGQQLQAFQKEGRGPATISVNVSTKQLNQCDLLASLEKCRKTFMFSPESLEVELTESCLMDDINNISQVVGKINQHGYRVTIDEFGTGYSSLINLQRLSPSTLKIDRSFIQHISTDQSAQKLVSAMLSMAYSLGVSVIVAGVEHEEQLKTIKKLIPDGLLVCYQGYLLSQPMPIELIRFPRAMPQLALACH